MVIATEWIIIYAILFLIIIIGIIMIIKINGIRDNDSTREIISELRLALSESNGRLIENILMRIASSEEKNQKNLMEIKTDTIERLQVNTTEMMEAFLRFQNNTSNNINESNIRLTDSISHNIGAMNQKIDDNLEKIGRKVDERLSEGFEKTNKTFSDVIERLTKIDEAQKKIDSLSTNIISLQDILTDKKSRGTFGEVQLNGLLKSIFGEKNEKIYQLQKLLPNGTMADAVLHIPDPVGMIAIDSKFPLENYQRMTDRKLSESERLKSEKEFKINVRKHIFDINSKYIITGVTSDQAVMFIPAEAIFAEINAYHTDLIEYGRDKKVWMASPTTLMSVLSTVQVVLKNIERDQYTSIIHSELNKLSEEFTRYKSRWDLLAKDIDKVSKDVKDIYVTSDKIERRFNQISCVDIEKNNDDILEE
ncbi:MAG: DNA recombination protein RmuC [Tissierellales bacterium]|nr:DNA recombination protein RmuC [Tissierellales bacterium]MBN2826968.1 DNA recombination protein RmuC [Tissierellales bacterium]